MSDKQFKERMTILFNRLCESADKKEIKKIFAEAVNLGMEYQHYVDVDIITKNF